MKNTCCIILGGGRGTRLYPLVKERSKPAVPIAGKYRMIDIPISNCINSNLRSIFVLTQFKSASLNNHITRAYSFDSFSRGFVQVLAAEQTDVNMDWFQGTADAVRKHLMQFDKDEYDKILILSGDQIYRMNYNELATKMSETDADAVVATIPVSKQDAKGFGIMKISGKGQITAFVEKPQKEEELSSLALDETAKKNLDINERSKNYLASMGIYLFKKDVLLDILSDEAKIDFGKDIIPTAIKSLKIFSYAFQGYWEDVGTIKAFFESQIALGREKPPFDFYDENEPIYTHSRFLSSSKIDNATIKESLIADGCRISNAEITNCVVGVRSVIQSGSVLERVVMMGSDFYEMPADHSRPKVKDSPWIGVGKNCKLKNIIIDKNVRIGDNVVIENDKKVKNMESALYCIRDGIVIIPKNTVIKSGTII